MRTLLALLLCVTPLHAATIARLCEIEVGPTGWHGAAARADTTERVSTCWLSRAGVVGAAHAARGRDAACSLTMDRWDAWLRLARSEGDVAVWAPSRSVGLPVLEVSARRPTIGEVLTVVAWDESAWRERRTPVRVTGYRPGIIVVSPGTAHGMSGGPAVDASGKVVGQVSRGSAVESWLVDGAAILRAVGR